MRPNTLLLSVAAVTIIAIVGLLIELPSSAPYSIYNDGADGYSLMAEKYSVAPMTRLSSIADPGRSIVIAPLLQSLDAKSVNEIAQFVSKNGTVLLLDESNYSKPLLKAMNISAEVLSKKVYDYILNYNGDPRIPLLNLTFNNESYRCFAYEPSAIELIVPGNETFLIANTSQFSFIDNDGNGYFSPGDSFGPLTVALGMSFGEGRVFLIADLSFFSNGNLTLGDNEKLLSMILGNYEYRYFYMNGLSLPAFDKAKLYLSSFSLGSSSYDVREAVAFSSLVALALVFYYGWKAGLWK